MDYIYFFIVCVLLFILIRKGKEESPRDFYIVSFFILLLYCLRACVVGGDMYYYTMTFLEKSNVYERDDIEPLYILFQNCLRCICFNEQGYVIVTSCFSLIPVYFMIKKYSEKKILSLLFFFLFGISNLYFYAIRHILAISLLFVGIIWVVDGKKWKWYVYFACAALAYFMHHSTLINSIIFTILYYIPIKKKSVYVSIIGFTLLIGIIFNVFDVMSFFNYYISLNLDLTTERLDTYMFDHDITIRLNSLGNLFYFSKYSIVGLLTYLSLPKEKLNHWFCKNALAFFVFNNLFQTIDVINRIRFPFLFFLLIVISWVHFKNSDKCNNIGVVRLLSYMLFALFVITFTISELNYDVTKNSECLHPYLFFWENYNNHPTIKYF